MEALSRLSKLGDELSDAEAEVARLAEELKAASAVVTSLAEKTIPDLMDELEMEEFVTSSGFRVKVGDAMFSKKLTGAHVAALEWLRANAQGGLIRTNVDIPFAAGSEADADELVDRLGGEGIAAGKSVEVNAGQLKAAAKRMLEEGVDVPLDVLGIFQKRVAKLTLAKKRR